MWECILPPWGDRMADATQQMVKRTEYSAVNLMKDAGVDAGRWSRLPDDETIRRTVKAIESQNVRVILVDTADEALRAVVDRISVGAEVMHGTLTTFIAIGYDRVLRENRK